MACFKAVKVLFYIIFGFSHSALCYKLPKNDEKCPEVRARSNCDLDAVRTIYVIKYIIFINYKYSHIKLKYRSTVSSNDNNTRCGF